MSLAVITFVAGLFCFAGALLLGMLHKKLTGDAMYFQLASYVVRKACTAFAAGMCLLFVLAVIFG